MPPAAARSRMPVAVYVLGLAVFSLVVIALRLHDRTPHAATRVIASSAPEASAASPERAGSAQPAGR
ncbi:hypothetical protein AB0I68_24715 [Streptomyces sp. NPDC050448]|uniref:hypothetical protein n=1 Tax=Streptomyces sp. NPDC050448 TaxID=3155404 RepID=UPI00341907D1